MNEDLRMRSLNGKRAERDNRKWRLYAAVLIALYVFSSTVATSACGMLIVWLLKSN